jgi:mannitol-specific phosphotransferase system IIBC component
LGNPEAKSSGIFHLDFSSKIDPGHFPFPDKHCKFDVQKKINNMKKVALTIIAAFMLSTLGFSQDKDAKKEHKKEEKKEHKEEKKEEKKEHHEGKEHHDHKKEEPKK